MSKNRRDIDYLGDIQEAINNNETLTQGTEWEDGEVEVWGKIKDLE